MKFTTGGGAPSNVLNSVSTMDLTENLVINVRALALFVVSWWNEWLDELTHTLRQNGKKTSKFRKMDILNTGLRTF